MGFSSIVGLAIEGFRYRAVSRAVQTEQLGCVRLAKGCFENVGGRVNRAEATEEAPHDVRLRNVGLRHDNLVRGSDLLDRLRVAVKVQVTVDRVDRRQNQIHREMVLQDGISEDGVQDRGGVREAGGLDDDAVEARYLAPLVQVQQLQQCLDEVLAGGAAA